MPRYLVERDFGQTGLQIPPSEDSAAACLTVVAVTADEGVTWDEPDQDGVFLNTT